MPELIHLEQQPPVALVVLNRPEKRNALSVRLREELLSVLETLEHDPAVRAVVLTGSGNVFCAGFDLNEFHDPERRKASFSNSSLFHRRIWQYPKPIVAAINGPAMAGGLDLALLCDFRICSSGSVFGHPEIKFGAVPLFSILKYVVGEGAARQLCLTGVPITAADALRIGLVSEVTAPEEVRARALELAGMVAEAPLETVVFTKQCMRTAAGLDFEASFTLEHDQGFGTIPLHLDKIIRH